MNLLAHAYLSFNNSSILVGNMISDFVKGKKKFDYPAEIQKGITLHRLIDGFTDAHAATKEANKVFKPAVGLYAGAFTDVAYDHFLANDTNELTEEGWQIFTEQTYHSLSLFKDQLPERFAQMLPYMINQNWLFNYRFNRGIENSFSGLARRAVYLQSSAAAYQAFIKDYAVIKDCYEAFFPELKKYAFEQLQLLVN